jgi:hypothetical protein
MNCCGSACGVRRLRVEGGMAVLKFAGECSAMSERHKRIHEVSTDFRPGETEDETVITIETSPALMPPPWVNFLKQRLHVLHLDCKHVGAGRIVVMSTPHAAESVARLVLSAMQCADHYFHNRGSEQVSARDRLPNHRRRSWASGLPRLTDGRGRGSGVTATSTGRRPGLQPRGCGRPPS